MKKQLRILNLIDIPWNSALAAYAFDQARALKTAGHEVYFACPPASAAWEFARKEGLACFPLPDRKEPFLRLPFLKLKKVLAAERIDIISAHTGKTQTLAFFLSAFSAKRPALIRTKADARPPSKSFTFMRVSKIVAASDYIRNGYLKLGFAPEKMELVYQGISRPAIEAGRPVPPYKIGVLGRLDPVKGHDCFLKAAAELIKHGVKAEFHIAGYEAGIKYSDLKKRATELGLGAAAVFHGRVPDGFEFINSCDIGVIPSLGSEAVSRAALEWLASGRPVIASRAGSLGEFIAPEYLVSPGDAAALALKLETLLAAPGLLLKIGASNRAHAARDFSPEVFANRTNAVFENAAKGIKELLP
ncbi:MAG: glycosyltransferase family 4 protein [Elusimicrobia bacterium]|nr:glycosyltransferase family 4 protein [Elusimicrobiota bacterium]